MGSEIKKVVANNVPAPLQSIAQKVAPALLDSDLIKGAMPGLQSQVSSAMKNVNLSDLNPFSNSGGGATRVDPAAEAAKLGMSLDQYNNLSFEELNRLNSQNNSQGFFGKAGSAVGNFFTDDPNSGWFDNMRNNANLTQYDTNPATNAAAQAAAAPSAFSGIKDAFGGALKKVASPVGLETLGGLAGGLGSMYLNNQGTKAATAGQDAAQNLVRQASAADLENFGKVGDSQEQLAMRSQAMRGLSDRASMGLTPEDQMELQKINRQSAQQFKANNATIGQDMQRRGMANSGLGLAQSMGAADQALQNQATAGQNQAAQSFAAKQGALTNLAGQSNTALQNDYSRQIGKAQNISNVNQFNAQQQAINEANKGKIQQGAKTAQGQGVQDIVKGAIGTLGK